MRLQGLPAVIGPGTRLVVLGSFPGAASLRTQQYYGHPRNHFWPLVGALWGLDLPAMPYNRRLSLLLERGLGLWDVYASCYRVGSLDQAIREARLNDLDSLPRLAPDLCLVAHNGGESARVMKRVQALGLPVVRLPSSSPANAGWTFDDKLAAWKSAFQRAGI